MHGVWEWTWTPPRGNCLWLHQNKPKHIHTSRSVWSPEFLCNQASVHRVDVSSFWTFAALDMALVAKLNPNRSINCLPDRISAACANSNWQARKHGKTQHVYSSRLTEAWPHLSGPTRYHRGYQKSCWYAPNLFPSALIMDQHADSHNRLPRTYRSIQRNCQPCLRSAAE